MLAWLPSVEAGWVMLKVSSSALDTSCTARVTPSVLESKTVSSSTISRISMSA